MIVRIFRTDEKNDGDEKNENGKKAKKTTIMMDKKEYDNIFTMVHEIADNQRKRAKLSCLPQLCIVANIYLPVLKFPCRNVDEKKTDAEDAEKTDTKNKKSKAEKSKSEDENSEDEKSESEKQDEEEDEKYKELTDHEKKELVVRSVRDSIVVTSPKRVIQRKETGKEKNTRAATKKNERLSSKSKSKSKSTSASTKNLITCVELLLVF